MIAQEIVIVYILYATALDIRNKLKDLQAKSFILRWLKREKYEMDTGKKVVSSRTAEELFHKLISSDYYYENMTEALKVASAHRQLPTKKSKTKPKINALSRTYSQLYHNINDEKRIHIEEEFAEINSVFFTKNNESSSDVGLMQALEIDLDSLLGEFTVTIKNQKIELILELILLVLNIIAVYGYFIGILAFYCNQSFMRAIVSTSSYPQESVRPYLLSTTVSYLKLGFADDDAEWYGNLSGE